MNSLYNKKIFLRQIMKKHFPIIIEQDKDGVYIVECPLFKGCRSYVGAVKQYFLTDFTGTILTNKVLTHDF